MRSVGVHVPVQRTALWPASGIVGAVVTILKHTIMIRALESILAVLVRSDMQ